MNWQSLIVGVIVAAAALYVAKHLLTSLGIARRPSSSSSCAAGCGQCGADERGASVKN